MKHLNISGQSAQAASLEVLRRLSEGESAFRVASAIYQENMPDATVEDAEQAAGRIAGAVREYNAGIAEAGEDARGWLNSRLDRLTEGRDLPMRCATLAQARAVLETARGDEPSGETRDYGNAAGADETRLRGELASMVQAMPLYGVLTDGMAEGLEACLATAEDAGIVLPKEEGDEPVKVALSMLSYVRAAGDGQTGMAPEAFAYCVSAGVDTLRCSRARALGKMSAGQADTVKRVIGIVLTALVVAAIIYTVLVLLPQLPALIPAGIASHTRWLAPAIKHLGRFLPAYLTLASPAIISVCGNIVNSVWELFDHAPRSIDVRARVEVDGNALRQDEAAASQTPPPVEATANTVVTADTPAYESALADA